MKGGRLVGLTFNSLKMENLGICIFDEIRFLVLPCGVFWFNFVADHINQLSISDSHGEHSKAQTLGILLWYPRQNSYLGPLSRVFEHGNCVENIKPVSVHPLPLKDDYRPKEETILESAHNSPDLSTSSPSKEHLFQQFPGLFLFQLFPGNFICFHPFEGREIKRRKRHRRKHVENQEPCTMRGVYYKNRKWQAAIKVDKKQIHLGTVSSEEEAARLYDRAAFMCGREPNFELSEEEKQELGKYKWDEFLAITRSAITNKKGQRRIRIGSRRKAQNNDSDDEDGDCSFSASEDETLAP
ncbi:hypothetical protein DH2020_021939 [Rehmannia glutinosa]|uniref:AP2/ERF domain-containing protein n=1 Tax=Rehmannia glutinosa TaxID=99300 RepID=A0ABR0WDG7_REHGL